MRLGRGLRARLTEAGQGFLVDYCEALDPAARETLLNQLETIDLDLVARLRAGTAAAAPPPEEFSPLPYVGPEVRGPGTKAAKRGRAELRAGRVAFVLLAGGQASRLRWNGPKGTFPIGPATERSLFQILVEQIVRAQRDYGAPPPLAVTTSATTDAAIRTHFERQDCFGVDRDCIAFACQASLPALDPEGRMMLAAPDRIFTSPDGHGGALQAIESGGVLDQWADYGITTVCTLQVDNPLLKVVDPDFIGRLLLGGAPIWTKVILKQEPSQKLGVVVRAGGCPAIVEYSEIRAEQARATDPDGRLTYRLGSIAVHAFRLDFLRRELARELPFHAAHKQIPCTGEDGNLERRPGVKYERFLFDLFPRARDIGVVQVVREREYEPVKNAEGNESPATARAALAAEYRRWYVEAGKTPPETGPLELSPLEVVGPEDLR